MKTKNIRRGHQIIIEKKDYIFYCKQTKIEQAIKTFKENDDLETQTPIKWMALLSALKG